MGEVAYRKCQVLSETVENNHGETQEKLKFQVCDEPSRGTWPSFFFSNMNHRILFQPSHTHTYAYMKIDRQIWMDDGWMDRNKCPVILDILFSLAPGFGQH